jgi:hypothetical protein
MDVMTKNHNIDVAGFGGEVSDIIDNMHKFF